MHPTHVIIDRHLHRLRLDRAAPSFAKHDFLKRECALRLADRLEDLTRQFPLALELGSSNGILASVLAGQNKITQLVQSNLSSFFLPQNDTALVLDEELLPFAENSFDAVVSVLALQWVNDLPGCLIQLRHALKPDGLLLVSLPGPGTLHELRESLAEAQTEIEGGITPRILPFVDVRDAGSLLQRAGFALPVIDSDQITVTYNNMFALLEELRGMGAGNALFTSRARPISRTVLQRAAAIYAERYPSTDGGITATLEITTLTAWKPHASQQQASRRGSGNHSLAAALGSSEQKI